MKNTKKFSLLLLLVISQYNFPQPITNSQPPNSLIRYPESGIQNPATLHPDSNIQYPETSIKHPDYRNHINIPEYDPSLMPLKTVRTGTGVWTELNPKVPRVDYLGIHFINKDTGWACGGNGALIKSTDGGQSWLNINAQTTTPILKIRSFDGAVVIASGYNGLILRSTDGGETFTQVASGVTGDLWGLQMLNDTLGWACGNRNSLIKTIDGGLTWQQVLTQGYTSDYWWIDFLTESYGFIVANGKVLRTTDGGNSWEIIQAGDDYPLFCVDVIDSLHIAAAGYGGTGYSAKNIYSSDAGYTWINGGQLTNEAVNCIQYLNPDTGYVILSEVGLWKTTNRGINWRLIDSASFTGIGEYEIQLLKHENVGYNAGTVIKLYNSVGNFDKWERLVINDNFYDVYFINENTGFALSGAFYKTTDGGIGWVRNYNAPGGYEILFLDSLVGLIGGSQTMYKTTDGGNTWYQPSGIPGGISKIFFVTNQIGWATSGRNILKTTDTGENWFVQITLPSDSYTSIYFIDSLNGWATSRYIWQTTNGGTNWMQRNDVPILFNNDIYFPSLDTGFVISGFIGNNLYKTVNGGINWQADPIIDAGYNFNYFPNKHHWILNGVHQRWETFDNGINWTNITPLVPSGFNRFYAPEEWIGYAVGGFGLILKYFDSTYVPVELVNFTANYFDNRVCLNWSTASEVNNHGFKIFKSTQLHIWEEIGFVNGGGTSTEKQNYSFTDKKINGECLYYKIKQIDFDGSYKFSEIISVQIPLENFVLTQNYPNPANPTTIISFTVPQKTLVKIELFSITGEKVREIVNEEKERGIYSIEVDLNNYSSGMYFYRITTNSGFTATKKLILIK